VHRHILTGHTDVVDADLSKYFDTIPHRDLMQSVARRILDRHVLHRVKMWLEAPVEERDGDGTRRMRSGKGDRRGTPQGGVVSPLLANLYMNRFLKHWRLTGRGEAFKAHVVAYADDFVILSRARAGEALAWTRAAMTKLGLTLNEAKTSLRDARKECFDFLGYTFGPRHRTKDGRLYSGASPSKKSVARIKTKIGGMLTPANMAPWPKVRQRLNRLLLGWSAYFSYGSLAKAYWDVDHSVVDHVRAFLARRHKMQNRGTRKFSRSAIYAELAVVSLWRHHPNPAPKVSP
jgi:RNA-directed DNA polymerase